MDADRGAVSALTTTYQQQDGRVTAPPSAASMKIQFWNYMNSGWVTFDDVSVAAEVTRTSYYYAGATRIGMRTGSGSGTTGPKWMVSDHLGSTSKVANGGTGAQTDQQLYKAWGENRYPTTSTLPTTMRYTGQRQDSYINLYWYNSRWYDPVLGRWVQPDSIVPEAAQGVQAWDRYAYANNSPVVHNDPSGHCIDGLTTILCIAMGVGALVGGAVSVHNLYQNNDQVSAGQVVEAAIGGALGGAVLGGGLVIAGAAAFIGVSAVAGVVAAGPSVKQAIQNGLSAVQNGVGQGYNSFKAFKAAEGSAGQGMAWHHIVTQTSPNLQQFGAQAIHNTNNLIKLPNGAGSLHQQVTNLYNSVNPAITGSTQRVYQWLQTQSFESQWEFGMNIINNLGGAQHIIEQMPK